jgi:hypothetical protein
MNKYVKTTKGIYELNNNMKFIDFTIYDNGKPIGIKTKLFDEFDTNLGEVVAQSENLMDLIEVGCGMNGNNKVLYYFTKNCTIERFIKGYGHLNRYIGMIWCGDDLVKVADWDNEKGEWELC